MPGYFNGFNAPSDEYGSTNSVRDDVARQGVESSGFFERLFGKKKAPGAAATPPATVAPSAQPQASVAPKPAISSGKGLVDRILGSIKNPPQYNATGAPLVPGTPFTMEQFLQHLQQAQQTPPGFQIPGMGRPVGDPNMPPPIPQPPPMGAPGGQMGAMMGPGMGQAVGPPPPPGPPQMPPMAQAQPPLVPRPQPFAPPPQPQRRPPFPLRPRDDQPGYFSGGPIHMMRGGYPEHLIHGMPTRYARGSYVAPDGHGDGRSDHVSAKLSPGEFVVDAETVSLLGNGDNDAGARRLEQFRSGIRKQKGRALAKGKFSPNAKTVAAYAGVEK